MIIHVIIILACLGVITFYKCCTPPDTNPNIEKAAEMILEKELGVDINGYDVKK